MGKEAIQQLPVRPSEAEEQFACTLIYLKILQRKLQNR